MPRLRKKIVSPGVYHIPDPATGRMQQELVTPDRIQHWANEGNRYLQNGNQLPAPWSHIDPATGRPVVVSANGMLPRSDINGGFWDRLTTEFDPEMGLTLVGEIDVDGDENDPNTPAGKIGKTVRETSIFTSNWQDGKGNSYRDCPLHIAMITHPIQPGQPNFEKVPTGTLALAMSNLAHPLKPIQMAGNPPSSSQRSTDPNGGRSAQGGNGGQDPNKPGGMSGQMGGNGSPTSSAAGADINQVIAALRQCGIDLPDDTNPENFFERLLVATRQKAVSEGSAGGDLYNQPGGAETKQPAPVAMSATATLTSEQFAALPKETLMSHPLVKQLVDANNALLELTTQQARNTLGLRVKKLIDEGRVTQKYADEQLAPLITGFAMSFGANAGKSPIEMTLAAIEAMPAPAAQQRQANYNNPSLLLGTAMSHVGPLMGQAIDNPYIHAADPGSAAGVDGSGNPVNALDIIKNFMDATGGVVSPAG